MAQDQTVLAIDIGGSHVKIRLSTGGEERKVESGKTMTGPEMVAAVTAMAKDMTYDVVAMGYPGPVVHNKPLREPVNLGESWVGCDYEGEAYREKKGNAKWQKRVHDVVERLSAALEPDEVVIGGGNVEKLDTLPPKCRRGDNALAFEGGFRLRKDPALIF
ncbi:ROK family protein [Agrobacterium sp. S2]|nr:ROK family protein [Agrobacterium sp. S2]